MVLIFVLYALYASLFTMGKEILSFIPPIFFVGIRMTIAGILLLGFLKYWRRASLHINRAHYLWFAAIVLFHIYLSYVTEYLGMTYISSIKACLLYNLSPFITALYSYIFFKEIMTRQKWVGLLIGFFGFIPMLMHENTESTSWLGMAGNIISYPELLIIASVSCACLGWIAMRKLTVEYGYSYFFINGFGMLIGGLMAVITSFLVEPWPDLALLAVNGPFWLNLWAIIIVGNVIAYNLYGKLLATYSATILSFFGSFTPLFGALFGWFFLGESISSGFFITLALSSLGLYLFYQEELRQGYIIHK